MKLLPLICCFAVVGSNISYAQEDDPWAKDEKVQEVRLPDDTLYAEIERITIKLLVPLPILGMGNSGSSAAWAEDIDIYHTTVGDHSFAYTSEGDLFIDLRFAGRFRKSDDLRYGYGRFWANGKPCDLLPLTEKQKQLFSNEPLGPPQPDGSQQLTHEPWNLFVRPCGYWGETSGHHLISDGMTVLRFEHGSMYLHGVPYGMVKDGDDIRVLDGIVYINKQLRPPAQGKTIRISEQAGAGQTATKSADKVPAKVKPATPTSKDRPR